MQQTFAVSKKNPETGSGFRNLGPEFIIKNGSTNLRKKLLLGPLSTSP